MFYYDKKEHKKHKLGNNEVGSLQGVGDIGLKEYRKQWQKFDPWSMLIFYIFQK